MRGIDGEQQERGGDESGSESESECENDGGTGCESASESEGEGGVRSSSRRADGEGSRLTGGSNNASDKASTHSTREAVDAVLLKLVLGDGVGGEVDRREGDVASPARDDTLPRLAEGQCQLAPRGASRARHARGRRSTPASSENDFDRPGTHP